jgi:predicted AlkP superfamily pyrophosphatase or phosphodiesterase
MSTSLVNLVAELEFRLGGGHEVDRLDPDLAAGIPEGDTYVLALFDGLGTAQLDHARATEMREALVGPIEAPFPSTTTVSMATIATGMHPATHGTIGHQMWIPDLERVVNVLKWRAPTGEPIDVDTTGWLPSPNLWERLKSHGVEAITVQPGHFQSSPLTRSLYRGARFEPVYADDERIEATVQLASAPGRLVFVYFAEVDFAAHVYGQRSPMYDDALVGADRAWSELARRLPAGAVLVGTSDHGHVDFAESSKTLIRDARYSGLTFYGDPRALYVKGDRAVIDELATDTGARVVEPTELRSMLGDGADHPELAERLPDALLLAPPDRLLLPRGMDRRLIGYHGGDTPAERSIPLLVSG